MLVYFTVLYTFYSCPFRYMILSNLNSAKSYSKWGEQNKKPTTEERTNGGKKTFSVFNSFGFIFLCFIFSWWFFHFSFPIFFFWGVVVVVVNIFNARAWRSSVMVQRSSICANKCLFCCAFFSSLLFCSIPKQFCFIWIVKVVLCSCWCRRFMNGTPATQ